jgi:16S rRNA (guanine527-N7)-methyltransferase
VHGSPETSWPERAAPLAPFAGRFGLAAAQVDALRAFAQILAKDEHAPTTVHEPVRVRDDHLADALVALELPQVRAAATIADIGAGAGIPGVPLAIALPGARVTLLEGNGRKCEFLGLVVERLGLTNVDVVNGRAETWRDGIGTCDVVTVRALAPPDVVEEYAAPLLSLGGSLVAWRGKREPEAEAAADRAAAILGMSGADPLRVYPYPGAEHRYLHVVTKTRETPARVPRRDGVARKRPLGRA